MCNKKLHSCYNLLLREYHKHGSFLNAAKTSGIRQTSLPIFTKVIFPFGSADGLQDLDRYNETCPFLCILKGSFSFRLQDWTPLFLHFLYMVHKFYKLDTIAIEKRRINLTLFFSGTLLSCKILSICSPIARFNSRRCASHLNASMVMSLDWN